MHVQDAPHGRGASPVDLRVLDDALLAAQASPNIVREAASAVTHALLQHPFMGDEGVYAAYRSARGLIRRDLCRALISALEDPAAARRAAALVFKRVDQRLWKARLRTVREARARPIASEEGRRDASPRQPRSPRLRISAVSEGESAATPRGCGRCCSSCRLCRANALRPRSRSSQEPPIQLRRRPRRPRSRLGGFTDASGCAWEACL